MSAMNFIFESIPVTICLLVAIALISAVLFKSTVVFRSMMFSNLIWLASTYYFLSLIMNKQLKLEIYLALLVELFLLFIYIIMFKRLLKVTTSSEYYSLFQLKKWLKLIIVIYLILFIPLLFKEGFGLFSEGSRIQYIENSRFNRYATFLCMILGNIGLALSATIINRVRRWDKMVLLFLFMLFGAGLTAGSKGGFVLVILTLLSLVHLPKLKDYIRFLIVPIIACVVTIVSTAIFVGKFMSLDNTQMINLMFSRVFLCNDSRALSIDLANTLSQGGASLFQESYRGLYSILGFPSSNLPLGQLLYREAFSTQSFSGGNTSSTALLIAYGNDYEKLLFAFSICISAFLVLLFINKLSKLYIANCVVGILLIIHFSQDLLVMPLILNMVVSIMFIYVCMQTGKRLLQYISIQRTTSDHIKQT